MPAAAQVKKVTSRAEKQSLSYKCFSPLPTCREKQNSQTRWDRTSSKSKRLPPAEPPFFWHKKWPVSFRACALWSNMTVHQLQVSPEAEAMPHKSCCITAAQFHLDFLSVCLVASGCLFRLSNHLQNRLCPTKCLDLAANHGDNCKPGQRGRQCEELSSLQAFPCKLEPPWKAVLGLLGPWVSPKRCHHHSWSGCSQQPGVPQVGPLLICNPLPWP